MPMAFIGSRKPFPAVARLFIPALNGANVANPAGSDGVAFGPRRGAPGESPPSVAETLKLWNLSRIRRMGPSTARSGRPCLQIRADPARRESFVW
jgi:hypothetical protein